MKHRITLLTAVLLLAGNGVTFAAASEPTSDDPNTARLHDWRHVHAGYEIPDENYCDQPYIVITKDGNWLCVMTTGKRTEGKPGQHMVATISKDQGKTWGPLIDIEPGNGPEASYGVPLVVSSGRVYAIYTYNGDNVRSLPGSKKRIRADTLGWYCFRYSDDNGLTWSKKRYRIPIRTTAVDRGNQWGGKVQRFWGIDIPKISKSGVRFAFTKMRLPGQRDSEGWMMYSDNILTESDPEKINWELLPEGDHGIRMPEFGSVQEEHNHVNIGDDQLYMVYRTFTGYLCHTYSSDGGRSWTDPVHMTYSPDGRKMKNLRACPQLFDCGEGRYLFWFHNHSRKTMIHRNPVWLTGGVVRDGKMHWAQPEVLLYHNTLYQKRDKHGHHRPKARGMSYPSLVQQDGRYWITETQKSIARAHEIPADFVEGLWGQFDEGSRSRARQSVDGAVLALGAEDIVPGKSVAMPKLPDLAEGNGFSLDLWVKADDLAAGQTLLDSRDEAGRGLSLVTGQKGSLVFAMNDGHRKATWPSDQGILTTGKQHHVVITADGGPCIISVVSDGILNDGGEAREFGWGRFDPHFGSLDGGDLRLAPDFKGTIKQLRIYDRPLRTSEAVGNHQAGAKDSTVED